MKTIGLEEHFFTTNVVQAWSRLEPQWQNPPGLNARDDLAHRLTDLDTERFAAMEDSGLDVQVLSLTSPGVQNLLTGDAVAPTRAGSTTPSTPAWPPTASAGTMTSASRCCA